LQAEWKELVEQFEQDYGTLEEHKKTASSPQELRKEIVQLEQEKDQLVTKIKLFQAREISKNAEFADLLAATNLLRKEQEEEAKLVDKLRTQKNFLDISDQQILQSQQRLIDAKKAVGDETSAEEMLFALKSDLARNRNHLDELAFEIREKQKKLQENEERLHEPIPYHDQIVQMENKVIQYRNLVAELNTKLEKERDHDKEDKLALSKQQAQMMLKKKEGAVEEMKRLEGEKENMEFKLHNKVKELEKIKGPGYSKKTNADRFASDIGDLKKKVKTMKKELTEYNDEVATLERTKAIIDRNREDIENQVKDLERKYGVTGFTNILQNQNELMEGMGEVDFMKGKTLEELSEVVEALTKKIESKRSDIQPLTTEIKAYKKNYCAIEEDYQAKKAEYDRVISTVSGDLGATEEQWKEAKAKAYAEDSKATLGRYEIQAIDCKLDLLDNELDYAKGTKILNDKHRSYKDWMNHQLGGYESEIKGLKGKRDHIKQNYEPAMKQLEQLNNMKKLLEAKLNNRTHVKDGGLRGQEHHIQNMDVLVMNN